MTNRSQASLVKLEDTDLTIADPAEDIRGYDVVDMQGEKIGHVDGLMIDADDRKVRFLEVAAGGFLGLGEKTFLVPVDAISQITDNKVVVSRTREHIAGAPAYDPAVAPKDSFWEETYGYYGVSPYWGAGYAFPGIGGLAARPRR